VAAVSALKGQPFAPWTWVGAPRVASAALFYAVCVLLLVLLGVAAFCVYSALQGGVVAWTPNLFRHAPGPAPVSSDQLRLVTVRRPEPRRMVLGHRGSSMIATLPGDSLLVIGPRGSGRTSAFCVPIVHEWSGRVVAAGLGQDLVDATAGVRQRQGRVDVYDPGAVTKRATCTWSAVTGCEVMDVAVRRAGWMMPGPPGDAQQERAHDAASALLAVSLWAAAQTRSSAGELGDWLRDPALRSLRASVQRVRPPDPRAQRCMAALAQMSTPERKACCATVEAVLRAAQLGDPAAPTAHGPLDAGEFLRGGGGGDGTLYLVMPPDEPERAAPSQSGLLGALLDAAFGLASASPRGTLDRPLLLVLDGTAGPAPVRGLPEYLAMAGQLDVTFLVTFEDLGDVERGYGRLADDVVGSAQAVAFLGPQADERTLQLVADLERRWRAGGPQLHDSARLLGPGHALLLSEALPPTTFWTRPWHETPSLAGLVRAEPYVEGVGWTEVVAGTRR
jgi:type IV secretory pathway TraG/TraD family ATPase VirD4